MAMICVTCVDFLFLSGLPQFMQAALEITVMSTCGLHFSAYMSHFDFKWTHNTCKKEEVCGRSETQRSV